MLIAPESEDNFFSERAVIIAEKPVLNSEKLQCTLEKFSLKQTISIPLTRSLFVYCLEFVLTHRLAPLWNKIDKYFVQGRNFLAEENKICAIQAVFTLSDKITLAMKAQLMKLPKPKVEDFGVSLNVSEKFHQSKDFLIYGYSLENNKCLVLPSLKTGYITSISHHNSQDIDLKQYWKVMYGFRLPLNDPERDVFYSVRFPMSGKIFSYPEYCIRQREPQVFARCDHKGIFQSFLEDLKLRMPSICGSPLTFTSSTLYSTNSLHLASVSKQTNLTRTQTLSKGSQPFVFTKKKDDTSNTFNKMSRVNGGNSYPSSNAVSNRSIHGTQSQYSSVLSTGYSSQSGVITDTSTAKPYVPVFTKQKSTKELSQKKSSSKEDGELRKKQPVIPCFKKSVRKSKMNSNDLKLSSSGLAKVGRHDGSNIVKPGGGSMVDTPVSNRNKMVTNQDRLSLSLNKRHGSSNNTLNDVTQQGCLEKTNGERNVTILSGTSQLAEERVVGNLLCGSSQTAGQKADSLVTGKESTTPLVEQNQFVKKQSAVPPKKSAKGPDVSVDVRKMVAESKLSKVSASVIIKWLKSEGVKCKCKDKKQELMLKVYQHLRLVQPER